MPLTPRSRLYEQKLEKTRKRYESRNAFASNRASKAREVAAKTMPIISTRPAGARGVQPYGGEPGAVATAIKDSVYEPVKSVAQILNEAGLSQDF